MFDGDLLPHLNFSGTHSYPLPPLFVSLSSPSPSFTLITPSYSHCLLLQYKYTKSGSLQVQQKGEAPFQSVKAREMFRSDSN